MVLEMTNVESLVSEVKADARAVAQSKIDEAHQAARVALGALLVIEGDAGGPYSRRLGVACIALENLAKDLG